MSDWNETHRAVLEQHAEVYEHMTQRAPLIEQRLAAIHAALAALAEKDAQIAAWRKTCLCGDAERCLRETPAPPQEKTCPEHLSGVNDDYYMPGHKHETKGDPHD